MNREFIEKAESYLELAEKGEMPKEEAAEKRAVYAFLGTSSDDMICEMFDSGAFSSIIKGYVKLALKNTEMDANISEKILQELSRLFDSTKAKDVSED